MDDSNDTSNNETIHTEATQIAELLVEGEIDIDNGVILIGLANGQTARLHEVLRSFKLPQRLQINISAVKLKKRKTQ